MIDINRVTAEDNLIKIIESIKDAQWSLASEINLDDYTLEGFKKSLSQEQHIFLMANYDGVFAGMASGFVLVKPDGESWLYVNEMDVCINMQRKGVGTALLQFFLTEAKKRLCSEVWLGTEKDNLPANALYSSQEPIEVEEFVGYTYRPILK
jgi:ribosomal protein S18 acetylase RimI-like enzyme